MKLKIFTAALIFVFSIFAVSVCFAYSDTQNHWAEKEINIMSSNGIISGYTDGTFKPNQNMTRAELITVINRLLGNQKQNDRFVPDINVKDWYYAEIRKAIESGFVEGNQEGYVKPNNLITRQEAVVMLQRALVPVGSDVVTTEYNDIDSVSKWASRSFNTFLNKGYIKGYTDNTIKPGKNITRAEVVRIISNIVNTYFSFGEYTGKSSGTVLVNTADVKLKDFTVNGNLIVAEGAENLELENVHIIGDLVIRRETNFTSNDYQLDGKLYYLNYNEPVKDNAKYINEDYGISFSIPENTKVVLIEKDDKKINKNQKNLITLKVNQSDEYYFISFEDGQKAAFNRLEYNLDELDRGYADYYKYVIYGNERNNIYYVYLKRDNLEYEITLYNIENINILDSLVNSISLFEGDRIKNHKIVLYKNDDLNIKFRYPDYVAVDDSYNTNVVNDNQDAYYKLFLQVNNIVDLSNYTVEQLKNILVSLEDSDGEITESKIKKVYVYDAIEYTVKNDGKIFKSLYIIISKKLYHFVFLSSEDKMTSAGLEIYNDIVNSVEF